MQDLSLHILDVVENSISAGAKRIEIKLVENVKDDILSIEIKDNGKGMSEEARIKATDPFYTTRKTRSVGLGLPLLRQAAKEAEGKMEVISQEGVGTVVKVSFKKSHIDRKPVGSMEDTLIVLISGNPDIAFFYEHRANGDVYSIDTELIKATLEDIPINSPEVLKVIRRDMEEGLKRLKTH